MSDILTLCIFRYFPDFVYNMQSLNILRAFFLVALGIGTFTFYAIKRYTVFQLRSYPIATIEEDNLAPERFDKRLKLLHSRCPNDYTKARERSNWVPIPHFLVDPPKKLLVCVVPKSGSSTWHGIVWALRRKRAGLDEDQKFYRWNDTVENHAMARKLPPKVGQMLGVYHDGDDDLFQSPRLGQSHRLVLARHPFARLISGWKDKFSYNTAYGDRMFKHFPKLKDYNVSVPPGNFTLAFEDLARYIADHGRDERKLDYHFMPATSLCKPCNYAYTYILKAESVDKDQQWLMNRINMTDLKVVRRGVNKKGSLLQINPSDSIKEYMSKLDLEVVKKLYTVYVKDFVYFGYTFSLTTMKSGGFE
uniref:carbohydrate sulfotransferase 10-like n=1 Tax=Styela clava TaxID=7725 RepID=UPI00193AC120|nr:carbohydrate sulfotransferase 10-like [Styela clava]